MIRKILKAGVLCCLITPAGPDAVAAEKGPVPGFPLHPVTEESKAKLSQKVAIVSNPEVFTVKITHGHIFLPQTPPFAEFPVGQSFSPGWQKLRPGLLCPDRNCSLKPPAWKFVIVPAGRSAVMRAGNKKAFGKIGRKGLHHPTLSGGAAVITAGIISEEEGRIVLDIDSGNYGLSEALPAVRRQHLLTLGAFLRANKVAFKYSTHFHAVAGPDTACIILDIPDE